SAQVRGGTHAVWDAELRIRPNILHIILDGYAHASMLEQIVGMDNGSFERELRSRNFIVVERASANYPSTYLSLASILAMDYVALPESPPYADRNGFYAIIRGGGPAVAGLRRAGY